MRRTSAPSGCIATARLLLSSSSRRAPPPAGSHGHSSRPAQAEQFLYDGSGGAELKVLRLIGSRKSAKIPTAAIIFLLGCLAFSFPQFAFSPRWAQTGTTTNAQPAPRKTSKPYVGDLSVFEDTDRDKKFHF